MHLGQQFSSPLIIIMVRRSPAAPAARPRRRRAPALLRGQVRVVSKFEGRVRRILQRCGDTLPPPKGSGCPSSTGSSSTGAPTPASLAGRARRYPVDIAALRTRRRHVPRAVHARERHPRVVAALSSKPPLAQRVCGRSVCTRRQSASAAAATTTAAAAAAAAAEMEQRAQQRHAARHVARLRGSIHGRRRLEAPLVRRLRDVLEHVPVIVVVPGLPQEEE